MMAELAPSVIYIMNYLYYEFIKKKKKIII